MRVADRRQKRARIDGQRFKDDQPADRDLAKLTQREREGHDDKQRHIVGQKRRQHRGGEHHKQGQPALGGKAAHHFTAQNVKIAAQLDPFGEHHQAAQGNDGSPVNRGGPSVWRKRHKKA